MFKCFLVILLLRRSKCLSLAVRHCLSLVVSKCLLGESTNVWTPGVGSDRSLGRSKELERMDVTTLHSHSRIGCLGSWHAEMFLVSLCI